MTTQTEWPRRLSDHTAPRRTTPALRMRPSGCHTMCASGQYTRMVNSTKYRATPANDTRSANAPAVQCVCVCVGGGLGEGGGIRAASANTSTRTQKCPRSSGQQSGVHNKGQVRAAASSEANTAGSHQRGSSMWEGRRGAKRAIQACYRPAIRVHRQDRAGTGLERLAVEHYAPVTSAGVIRANFICT